MLQLKQYFPIKWFIWKSKSLSKLLLARALLPPLLIGTPFWPFLSQKHHNCKKVAHLLHLTNSAGQLWQSILTKVTLYSRFWIKWGVKPVLEGSNFISNYESNWSYKWQCTCTVCSAYCTGLYSCTSPLSHCVSILMYTSIQYTNAQWNKYKGFICFWRSFKYSSGP